MYLSFYKLKEKPFDISTNPKYLWLGEKHKEALSVLKYGILDNKGFLLLTGDVGTGKTTLINGLLNSLGADFITAVVCDPGLERMDLFRLIAHEFGLDTGFKHKTEFLLDLKSFLEKSYASGKKALLIIDEAQRLNLELFEEIRLLSNIEKQHIKLLNIFFVGQNELNDLLLDPVNRALRQRITISYHLDLLSPEETEDYIRYRLKVAGAEKTPFMHDAVREIHICSGGYPRRINILCDHALLTGYSRGKPKINREIIRECFEELEIPFIGAGKANKDKKRQRPMPPNAGKAQPRFRFLNAWILLPVALLLTSGIWWGLPAVSDSINRVRSIISFPEIKTETESNLESAYSIPSNRVDAPDPGEPEAEPVNPGTEFSNGKTGETSEPAAPDPQKALPKAEIASEIALMPPLPEKEYSVFFNLGSHDLSEDSLHVLNRMSLLLMKHTGYEVVVRGYTDTSGNLGYNMKLSEIRAHVVKTYLIGKGVDPAVIRTLGMGPTEREGKRSGGVAQGSGRRVEIEILWKKVAAG